MGVESLASLASVVGNEYWKQSVTYERDRSYWRIVCLRANIIISRGVPTYYQVVNDPFTVGVQVDKIGLVGSFVRVYNVMATVRPFPPSCGTCRALR